MVAILRNFPCILLALATGSALGATRLEAKYDKFENTTVVSIKPDHDMMRRRPSLSVFTAFPGKNVTKPKFVDITFWRVSDSWRYLECHSVAVLVDEKPYRLPESKHGGNVGSGYVTDRVSLDVKFDDVEKFAAASSIEFKICNDEFALTPEELSAIREFARYFGATPHAPANSQQNASGPSTQGGGQMDRKSDLKRAIDVLSCNAKNVASPRDDVTARCGGYYENGNVTFDRPADRKPSVDDDDGPSRVIE